MDYRKDNGAKPVEVEWDPSIHLKLKDTNARGDVVFNIGGKNSKAKVIELFWHHYYDNLCQFISCGSYQLLNFSVYRLYKFLRKKLNSDGINTFLK